MILSLPPQYDDFTSHALKDEDNQNVSAAVQLGHLFISMGESVFCELMSFLILLSSTVDCYCADSSIVLWLTHTHVKV